MRAVRTVGIIALSALALAACDDGDDITAVTAADLEGTWSATSFTYTDAANPNFSVDAIEDAEGDVTLDVEESGAFTGTVLIPGLTPETGVPVGGTLSIIDENTMRVDFDADTEELGLFSDFDAEYEYNGQVLTWENDDTSFDFPDEIEEFAGIGARGEVDATLNARFVR